MVNDRKVPSASGTGRTPLRWRIEGPLTIATVAGIRSRLLDELSPGRQRALELDLGQVDTFDAAGLQLLLAVERTLGSGLVVENFPPGLAEVLRWTPLGARCTRTASKAGRKSSFVSHDVHQRTQETPPWGHDWLIGVDSWHLSIRFDQSAFRADVEPLAAIRRFSALGVLVHVNVVDDCVPALGQLNPTACHLGFELDLRTDVEPQRVRQAIDALAKLAWVRAIAPAASVDEYLALIHALPEGSLRASRLLLASGALTPWELETGLRARVRAQADSSAPRP